MRRFRALLAAGGVALIAAGLLLRPEGVTEQAEVLDGVGRYRNGRGRFGRAGHPGEATAAPAPSSPLLDGLVVYYPLDGDATDAVASNDGTATGAVTWETGKVGSGAVKFGGAGARIVAPGQDLMTDITVAFWVNLNANGGYQFAVTHILGAGGATTNYQLMFVGSQMSWFGKDDVAVVGPVYEGAWLNTWRFYVGTRVAATGVITWYDNDVEVFAGAAGPVPNSVPSASLYLGNRPDLYNYLHGMLDEVGIWNRILTSDERAQLYNAGDGLAYPFN